METGTIILIAILAITTGAFFFLKRFYGNSPAPQEEHHEHDTADGVCCGKHSNCSKGHDSDNLYFDDEELDRFKGADPEKYTDEEIEEFRQILYTMREEEIDTWVHCLQTREIELPQVIREEILMILQP